MANNIPITVGSGAFAAGINVTREGLTEYYQGVTLACDLQVYSGQTNIVAGAGAVPITAALTQTSSRRFVVVANIGPTNEVFIGPSGVTALTGYPIQPGRESQPLPLGGGLELYGFSTLGTIVAVLELG